MRWKIARRRVFRKVGSILKVSGEVAAMAVLLVIVVDAIVTGGGAGHGIRGGTIAKFGDGRAAFVGRFDDDANIPIWR